MDTRDAFACLPPRRLARIGPALVLAAVVLGGHAWLVALLAHEAPPRAGLPRPGLVQLRSLLVTPALDRAPLPATPLVAAAPASPAAPRPAGRRMPPPPDTPRSRAADPAPTPATAWPDAPATATADQSPEVPAAAGDLAEGEPPPLYPTRLPAPVQLRYALQYNGRAGEALLVWQHDGAVYRLTLDGSTGAGQPLVAQASSGALDQHGLAPERFLDRRGSGRQHAANFRHDIGRIGYSGPAHQHPAWPGAQDRLSWLAQLAAILGAADALPPELRLFVADAQGHAGLWQLQRQPDASGPTPWGDLPLQHWQRTPPRPEGLRVDIWLAAQPGTRAAAWPLRLRFAVPRSGDSFELNLLATP